MLRPDSREMDHIETNLRMMFRFACLFIAFSTLPVTSGGRLLVIMLPAYSHVQPLVPALEELEKSYGHESTIIVTQALVTKAKLVNASVGYIVSDNLSTFDENSFVDLIMKIIFEGEWMRVIEVFKEFSKFCSLLLTDTKLLTALKEKSFDLVLIGKSPVAMCLNIIAYNLSVPFMHYGLIYDPVNDRIPFIPSFVPALPIVSFTDKMTFYQRVMNSLAFFIQFFLPDIVSPAKAVETYAPQKPPISTSDLWKQVQFNLYETDVLLDYPRPVLPNFALVGGIGTQPPHPLMGELKDFVNSANNGLVVVSFGSGAKLPRNIVDKLIEAFQKVKNMKFVYKNGKSVIKDKNIFIMPWMPQNDLLGHPNTKLFITHCGNGGQFEALYHGVPMIGFPVFAEQHYNANRMVLKGFGVAMEIRNFAVEELVYNINHVFEDKRYSKAIKLASEIFRNRPQSPKEKAAYWIDHVMKYGGAYMRPASLDMPFYQYMLLDVILFLSAIILAIILGFLYLCKICKSCKRRKQKTEKTD